MIASLSVLALASCSSVTLFASIRSGPLRSAPIRLAPPILSPLGSGSKALGILCSTFAPAADTRRLSNLAQVPGLYFIDKAANAVLVRYERARFYALYRLAHVLFEVGEGLQREVRLNPHLLLDLLPKLLIGEGKHPAVGVVDEHYFARSQEALRDHQGADLVVRDNAPGIADDVRITL